MSNIIKFIPFIYNVKVQNDLYSLKDIEDNIFISGIKSKVDKFIDETEVINILKNHKNFNTELLNYLYENKISINILNFENNPIHVIKKDKIVYIKLRDIQKILDYTTCNKLPELIEYNKNFNNILRVSDIMDTKYGKIFGKNIMFLITLDGLEQILIKSKKNISIRKKLVEFFNLEVNIGKESIISKETRYDDIIKKSFPSVTIKNQFNVKNYFIDWYFPDYKLALECDEFNHKKYLSIKSDKTREDEIKSILNCTFIRFNPDSKDFCIYDLIGQISSFLISGKELINKNSSIIEIKNNIEYQNNINFNNIDKDFINKYIDKLNFKTVNLCIFCSKEITHHTNQCVFCCNKNKVKESYKNKPSYETLTKEIEELGGYVATGKKYGVSDNSIRNWIKNYEKYLDKKSEA